MDVDIHSDKYLTHGTSKAKKLRAFWEIESDYLVGRLLNALIDYAEEFFRDFTEEDRKLAECCREKAARLMAGGPSLAAEPPGATSAFEIFVIHGEHTRSLGSDHVSRKCVFSP